MLGLDCLWTTIFLGVDLEAWIKLFEGWKGGKSGLNSNPLNSSSKVNLQSGQMMDESI